MKFLYGKDNLFIDITKKVFETCLYGNIICIPGDDNARAKKFGDHLFGVVKIIKIIFDNNVSKIYEPHVSIILQLNMNELNFNYLDRKEWWNNIGKNITNSDEKLNELHKYLIMNHGDIKEEYPEQMMSINNIKEDDVVLELGANIGRNTCVIAQILKDDKNLLTLECDPISVEKLTENRDLNKFNFHIEPSALSKRNLIQRGWDTIISDVVLPGYSKVNTITWDELKNKYPLNFTVLVADCEGALYYILQDEPKFFDNFKTIIMENDYWDMNNKTFVDNSLKNHGFSLVHSEGGGWGPCTNCFFQVWKR